MTRGIVAALAVIVALATGSFASAAPKTFEDAKAELRNYVYADRNRSAEGDLYCGCQWEWVGRSGGRIDFASCGFRTRAQENRAIRIEWEHIVPAAAMGQQRLCWQKGGRENCVKEDPVFRLMEADMHNLAPAVGEVNADRSNFRFGVLPSEPYRHGKCDFKVDFSGRVAEPRDEVKGMIARTYFYIYDRYDLRMSDQQQRLFMAWDRQFPVSAWERERDRRVAVRMGHHNPFVTGERTWSLGHRNAAEGVVTWLDRPQTERAEVPPARTADAKVRGNRSSKAYHIAGACPSYAQISPANIVEFASEQEAIAAGYRKAGNCR